MLSKMYYSAVNLTPEAHMVEIALNKDTDHEQSVSRTPSIPLFKILNVGFLGFGWSMPAHLQTSESTPHESTESSQV